MKTLLDFLKKYSDVDIPFINEFIKIQKGDKLRDPFKISLEIVAKWLHTTKRELFRTIKESYVHNIDYIVLLCDITQQNKGSGGHNKKNIFITVDTFKMLTMKSKTKKAHKIRYYYLTLEKLVDIYKNDIIKNQKKKIEQLEYNLKKKKFPVKGAIYIIKLHDGYKIGKTTDLNKRYKQYKTANKNDPVIEYIFYASDIDKLENCIKNILKDKEYKSRKEFYMMKLDDIIFSIKECDKLITKIKCRTCKKHTTSLKRLNSHIKYKHSNNKKELFMAIIKKQNKYKK